MLEARTDRVHLIDSEAVQLAAKSMAQAKLHNEITTELPKGFEGIGKLPGPQDTAQRNAEPVIHPARKVSLALKGR